MGRLAPITLLLSQVSPGQESSGVVRKHVVLKHEEAAPLPAEVARE
jgi:hypothetical protein